MTVAERGPRPSDGRARLVLCRGPRAAESRLLEEVESALDGRPPAPPVRLVVPSRSLRLHLLERLAGSRAAPRLGIACQTLHAVAREITERAGRPVAQSTAAFELAVRRRARGERRLADELGHLQDGWGAVATSVRDLLEAGLRPVHQPIADEALQAGGTGRGATRRQVERGRAVLRVAAAVATDLEELGVATRADLLSAAADAVLRDPQALPTGALLIHGFADVTGASGDLLEALLRTHGGLVIVDRPPDPTAPGRADSGALFTRRLVERLELVSTVEEEVRPVAPPRRLDRFRALGERAEVREVAERIRSLLDSGARPERIGLVARELGPYRSALRDQLDRAAVPFSGIAAAGPRSALGRRLQALADLVRGRGRTSAERWLDVVEPGHLGAPAADLRLVVATAGIRRLAELRSRRRDRLWSSDPWRAPLAPVAGGDSPAPPQVSAAALGAVLEAAIETVARLEAWAGRRTAPLGVLRRELDELVAGPLGWPTAGEATREVERALSSALGALPDGLALDGGEWTALLARCLEEAGRVPLGGRGGGVQVLDVTEARGRTFDHLFLVGLNRSRFPRPVREDPILPDVVRSTLARTGHGVLPDLQEKSVGHAEERYLFAQLLAAADEVTLSWLELDDADRPLGPSPLVERLRQPDDDERLPRVVPVTSGPPAADRHSTLDEMAVLAGLGGRRASLAPLLAAGLARIPVVTAWRTDPDTVARHRVSVLDEVDPPRGTPRGEAVWRRLGPFFGHLGSDPLLPGTPSVTHLEGFARCPWQTFLRRALRLEPLPDPLAGLPGLEVRWLGNLVHRVLEEIAGGDGRAALEEASERSPRHPSWPTEPALGSLVRRHAARLLETEGVSFPGIREALVAAAEPFLAVARDLDWSGPEGPAVLAVEVRGEVEIPSAGGAARRLRFRADRLDRRDEGLLLTDYKTGAMRYHGRTADSLRSELLREVAAGAALQVAAYAAALPRGSGAAGRYLGLRPDIEPHARRVVGRSGDGELREGFRVAAASILDAMELSPAFPRLVEPDADKEPRACGYCELREACLWGDSGARRRLLARGGEAASSPGDRRSAAFGRLWAMPAERDR